MGKLKTSAVYESRKRCTTTIKHDGDIHGCKSIGEKMIMRPLRQNTTAKEQTERHDTTHGVGVQLCMYQYTMLSPTAPRRRTYDDSKKQQAKITHGSAKAKK